MTKNIVIGVLAVLTLLLGGLYFGFGSNEPETETPAQGGGNVTGPIHRQTEGFPLGLQIGTQGSVISELKATQCNFLGMNVSQAATSTAPYDCAIAGIASGDIVFGQISTSTNAGLAQLFSAGSGWAIRGCFASSTAGYATCEWMNLTGAASAPAAAGNGRVGSSTNMLYIDN